MDSFRDLGFLAGYIACQPQHSPIPGEIMANAPTLVGNTTPRDYAKLRGVLSGPEGLAFTKKVMARATKAQAAAAPTSAPTPASTPAATPAPAPALTPAAAAANRLEADFPHGYEVIPISRHCARGLLNGVSALSQGLSLQLPWEQRNTNGIADFFHGSRAKPTPEALGRALACFAKLLGRSVQLGVVRDGRAPELMPCGEESPEVVWVKEDAGFYYGLRPHEPEELAEAAPVA